MNLSLDWMRVCAANDKTPCVSEVQVAYLAALLVGVVIFVVAAMRSRDLSTSTLVLMAIAIGINIVVGSTVAYLKLPVYLDSIGTVLVGALAGPWAGALTGLLADLIWSILPIAGGAGPTIAFFAPVGGVIGLMAGFWSAQGVFRLRAEDERVGRFLAIAAGLAAAALAFIAFQQTGNVPNVGGSQDEQNRFVALSVGLVVLGVVVALVSARTIFAFRPNDRRILPSLIVATTLAAGALVFLVLRLLFSPGGYFSTLDGKQDFLNHVDFSGLALPDPRGLYLVAAIAAVVGLLAGLWASRGENARLFPVWIGGLTTGLVAAMMSAPIAAGVFGGVTGAGTDALVALFRTLGLNVFQSAFAQGLTSDPLDKTLSYTIVFVVLAALPLTLRTMFSRGEATVSE